MMGQLSPAAPARMELHRAPGDAGSEPDVTEIQVDDICRFSLADLAPGLVRLVVHRDGERPIATDWFRID